MAKKPNPKAETVFFDVIYEDGMQLSNRRVPGTLLSELDANEQVLQYLQKQDEEIAERSGKPRGPIKSVKRSAAK